LSTENCLIEQKNDAEKRHATNKTKRIHLSDELLLAKRHFSHFTPRDFDLSPYFEVIKPTLTGGFDYRSIQWSESE